MRVYADTSALLKRSVEETGSEELATEIDEQLSTGAVVLSSTLAWIEVSRALQSKWFEAGFLEGEIIDAVDAALSGVAERVINDEVVGLARRLDPPRLRSLDAIHLATALVMDVDLVLAYDNRLLDACTHHGLAVLSPGT